jgi:hypothetical protein
MDNNYIIELADVDDSNAVFITLDNPHYAKSVQMDYGFEWPKDKIQIIQAIKGAMRMGLKIKTMTSNNPEAEKFMNNYYEEYNA